MNLPSNGELSLYQLSQALDFPPASLTVNFNTFRSLLGAISDLLVEQNVTATLWVKLPPTERWLSDIERYVQQGHPEKIYLCSLSKETATALASNLAATPIVLETNANLKREFFLIVLSPQFCCLLLAQRPSGQAIAEGATSQANRLKIILSFSEDAIARVLAGIQAAIVVSDTTPEGLLAESYTYSAYPTSLDSVLLSKLLLKQIRHGDAIYTAKIDATVRTLTQSLNFNRELFGKLTQELTLTLTNMKTALRLLDTTQSKKEQRQRYLQLLQQQCDRQNFLLTGLLEIEQVERSVDESESSLRLEEVIPGIVSIYQPIAEEKGIILGYNVPPGLPYAACPSNYLRQILRNLLSNSLKFTPPQGRVYVRAISKKEAIELIVSDTGIGIDNSDLPQIFNSFYRGRNANNLETVGAGLGLTIVQQLLNRCGGSISVTSRLGRGATFTISLPIAVS
jgi:two-component system, OmpR family, phosphate regulon sensor histidine kinase PhoR